MTLNQEDPPPTSVDKDCAFFVRDALFPLRRDWGSKIGRTGGARNHGLIHPALMALDRLRTDLITLRPNSTSFSNIFPRGVLLVSQSDALAGSGGGSVHQNLMEYNGQPDVDESTASVEIVPNLLTVKCMRCSENSSFKSFVREKYKPWKNPDDDDYESSKEYELVLCSDRILKKDYYNQSSRQQRQQDRREDLPLQSMGAVEESLAREITMLQVQNEGSKNAVTGKVKPPIEYPSFPTKESHPSSDDAANSCEAFARVEIMAAKAAECLLVSKEGKTRMGSALSPQFLFPYLPGSMQRNFANRCAYKVAAEHTAMAAREAKSDLPKGCVKKAWNNSASR